MVDWKKEQEAFNKEFNTLESWVGWNRRAELADEYEITHWMPLPNLPKPTNPIDSFIASGGFDKAMGGKNGE